MELNFLRTGEYRFFEKYFDIHSFVLPILETRETKEKGISIKDIEVIKFENFVTICQEHEKFNKLLLPEILDRIKKTLKEKLLNKDDEIFVTKNEFFPLVELVVRENDKTENQKDSELIDLFNMLAKDEVIYKKGFIDIITSFGLPISVEEFLGPNLKKKEEIGFAEFCSLFKKKSDSSSLLFSTFYSSFYNSKDSGLLRNNDSKDSFPIQFNVSDEVSW